MLGKYTVRLSGNIRQEGRRVHSSICKQELGSCCAVEMGCGARGEILDSKGAEDGGKKTQRRETMVRGKS